MEVLQESTNRFEMLYSMLLDAIPSSVLMINRDMRIVSTNRNFLEKSNRSKSNTINCRLEMVFPAIILDQMNIESQIRYVFNSLQPTKGQRLTYRAPGVPMSIYYYRILPFSWQGIVENVILLMDDVTEQVRLNDEVRCIERHLASVFESVNDIIVSTDSNGSIVTWNPAAERLSGYSFAEVRGGSFLQYFPEDQHADLRRIFTQIRTGMKSEMSELDLVTNRQGRIFVSWVFSPMKDRKSEQLGIVAVGRDLTEYRKLKMELAQSNKFAALGVMAGGIAHEIRNPLAISSSAAQFLMEEDVTPEFRQECAQKIHIGINRASVIIENILKFARPSTKAVMEQVDLPSLINDTLTLIANQAKIQKISIRSCFPQEPITVSSVICLLQQVFINFFLNAINAMPDGGTLEVHVEKKAREVEVRISDTGKGISERDIDKIFDPFYTTSSVGQGTGLGLAITYSIVQQHSGTVEVNSVEGIGSDFILRLPIY